MMPRSLASTTMGSACSPWDTCWISAWVCMTTFSQRCKKIQPKLNVLVKFGAVLPMKTFSGVVDRREVWAGRCPQHQDMTLLVRIVIPGENHLCDGQRADEMMRCPPPLDLFPKLRPVMVHRSTVSLLECQSRYRQTLKEQ